MHISLEWQTLLRKEKKRGWGNDKACDRYQKKGNTEEQQSTVDLPRLSAAGAERWTISHGSVGLSVHICPSVMQRCARPQHTELTQTDLQRSESYDHMHHNDIHTVEVCLPQTKSLRNNTHSILHRWLNGYNYSEEAIIKHYKNCFFTHLGVELLRLLEPVFRS